MQSIGELFSSIGYQVKPENRRKELIKQFVDRIQECAKESQYQARIRNEKVYPIPSAKMIAIKLSHLKEIHDLEYFLGCCKEAKHFAKYFYSQLRVK